MFLNKYFEEVALDNSMRRIKQYDKNSFTENISWVSNFENPTMQISKNRGLTFETTMSLLWIHLKQNTTWSNNPLCSISCINRYSHNSFNFTPGSTYVHASLHCVSCKFRCLWLIIQFNPVFVESYHTVFDCSSRCYKPCASFTKNYIQRFMCFVCSLSI